MKPILFNADMVRAILDDRKTVTRRVVKPQPIGDMHHVADGTVHGYWMDGNCQPYRSPSHPGDILYVREAWCPYDRDHIIDGIKYAYKASTTPEADRVRQEYGYKWRPSIHMPKEAARIFLRVTGVRVERLQDITLEDCMKEGISKEEIMERDSLRPRSSARWLFAQLWNSTLKTADEPFFGWKSNPWVWVIQFERISREMEG